MNFFIKVLLIVVTVDSGGHKIIREVEMPDLPTCFDAARDFMNQPIRGDEPQHLKAGCDGEMGPLVPL